MAERPRTVWRQDEYRSIPGGPSVLSGAVKQSIRTEDKTVQTAIVLVTETGENDGAFVGASIPIRIFERIS